MSPLPLSLLLWISPFCLLPCPSQIDYTGCGINPARSFGSSVITHNFKDHWVRGHRAIPGGRRVVLVLSDGPSSTLWHPLITEALGDRKGRGNRESVA